ncbi:hypothetical protein V0M98_17655 [Pseudomonas silesiensis]|uniref:hypothetical protein n=1 Tax=Pseudomonas TaxID=286 RepID=UPI00123EE8A0|nr:hypothetical protein [Pseudomonas fluorescens]VVQ17190.1 hypothetical protein PS914_05974 [Pseudomonas fluorescens]
MNAKKHYELALSLGVIRKEEFATDLTAADREIALKAIAARATGKPDVAAAEILAGIAVLDGNHPPILLWPNDTAREEKAAWHKAEAAYWEESAQRFAEIMAQGTQSAVRTHSATQDAPSTDEQGAPRPLSASSVKAPHEAETQSPLPSQLGEHLQGSSDAC